LLDGPDPGASSNFASARRRIDGVLPPDWVNLLTWWWPQPTMRTVEGIVMSNFCTRDAVLCGDHARELECLLKPIGPDPRLEVPDGTA
jgi:hypothetical protein